MAVGSDEGREILGGDLLLAIVREVQTSAAEGLAQLRMNGASLSRYLMLQEPAS